MIDNDGYRANVGIVLCNRDKQLFWAHRIGHLDSWQFPQGGIDEGESAEEAMYRELKEEIGLSAEDVKVLGRTKGWLRYRLPQKLIRKNNKPCCIGQKQIWFLLELQSGDDSINLEYFKTPEFDSWKWVDYWHPLREIVYFKRKVYNRALVELSGFLFAKGMVPQKPHLDKVFDTKARRPFKHNMYRLKSR